MVVRSRAPRHSRPDRDGTVLLAAHVQKSVVRAFKIVAAEEFRTSEALIHEALANLLVSYGKALPVELKQKLRRDGVFEHFQSQTKAATSSPKI